LLYKYPGKANPIERWTESLLRTPRKPRPVEICLLTTTSTNETKLSNLLLRRNSKGKAALLRRLK
jgi:hypothetical protein